LTHPEIGETVLVSGATDGVGSIAVQLLKAAGARVIATAASQEERDFVTALGADETIDHRGGRATAGQGKRGGLDAALHFAGDGAAVAALLRSSGRLASTLGFSAEHGGRDDVTVTSIMANPVTATLNRLATAVADHTLRVPIQRTYALADVPQAF